VFARLPKYVFRKEGWATDQLDLFDKVNCWNNTTHRFIRVKEKSFERLDRIKFPQVPQMHENLRRAIKNGNFIDYHALRPFKSFEKINLDIVKSLE